MSQPTPSAAPATIKACCAELYGSDVARLLLGDSLHPGGTASTSRLAVLLKLDSSHRILDVACGRGTSAIHLARTVGCEVCGTDLSAANVEAAVQAAQAAGVADLCTFTVGDAECLGIEDRAFDAVICECAFCTFPDKAAAAAELARVLRPGGRVGLADVTRDGPAQEGLDGLLAWIACIADAQSIDGYAALLTAAGLHVEHAERHDDALVSLIDRIRARLAVGRVLGGTQPAAATWDIDRAQELARAALHAVSDGTLGYAIITARRK
jgi:arsenite methyltransferase